MTIRLRTRTVSANSGDPLLPGDRSSFPGSFLDRRPLTPSGSRSGGGSSPSGTAANAAKKRQVDDHSLALAMAQLTAMFPNIDEQYLAHCLSHYNDNPSLDERVAHVADKIVVQNHGYYPTIVPAQQTTLGSPGPGGATTDDSEAKPSPTLTRRRSLGSTSWSLFSSSSSSSSSSFSSCPQAPPAYIPTPTNPTATNNAHLRTLATLFPAVDPAHLRTLIDQHPVNTVVSVADTLLSVHPHRLPRRDRFNAPLTRADLFKSPEYLRGARARLYNSFPRLWKSSIKAYFAENALDFVATYLVLSALPENRPPERGGLLDAVVNTLFKRPRQVDPAMYDPELLADLNRLELALTRRQLADDERIAWECNRDEALREGQVVECACCLDDVPWEETVGCLSATDLPHLVCVTCLRRGVQEYVFGQGVKADGGEVKCFAPGEGCEAGYADADVLRAIRLDPKAPVPSSDADKGPVEHEGDMGADVVVPVTYSRYLLLRAKSAATAAGLVVHECPFCSHFTVSEPSAPKPSILLPLTNPNNANPIVQVLAKLVSWTKTTLSWINFFPILLAPSASLIQPLVAAHVRRPLPPVPAHQVTPLLDPRATLTLRWVVGMLSLHTLATLLHVPPMLVSCLHLAGMARIARLLHHTDVALRALGAALGDGRGEGAREWAKTQGDQNQLLMPSRVDVSTCVSPQCGRSVCLTCRGEWVPFHRCFEDVEDQSLETAVELAMSRAIKRVCPSCYLQFTKSDGCNLMTCPQCKYIMCYVCRREIDKQEKYQHFCQHFRVHGGKCRECTRCELYAREDERDVRHKAGAKAMDEWLARHPRHGLSPDEIRRVRELVTK